MYGPAGRYYDKIYQGKDYRGEALDIAEAIKALCPQARTLLDVGCGTGGHLQYLSQSYEVEGIDLSRDLVQAARQRLPGIPIHHANMINFKLDRVYDVILCLFSSIGYVKTTRRLNRAVGSMAKHLSPGGVLMIEPWFTEQTWHPKPVYATFVDDPDVKIARMATNRKRGRRSIIEMRFLIGTAEGIRHYREIHTMGLFTEAEMSNAFARARLECTYQAHGITGRGLYTGTIGGERG